MGRWAAARAWSTPASTCPLAARSTADRCPLGTRCTAWGASMTPPEFKVLLVGDYPPPNGGVATHVDELFRAVRARGGQCEVLDIGKGQLPADGVTPAAGLAAVRGSMPSFGTGRHRLHTPHHGSQHRQGVL